MKCGLLGRKLGHSYSPQIHSLLGSYSYTLQEVEPADLAAFFRATDLDAMNVTIPYKKDVLPYCSKLSQTAMTLGSVNTMVRQSDGSWYGHNTDYFGFHSTLERCKAAPAGKKALVLGTGGAACTAVAVLQDLGAQVISISRSGVNNYTNLYLHSDAELLINATPVGMYPDVDAAPVDLAQFPKLACVVDMIYNPARTQLLLQAEQLGIPAENGLWMLVSQAAESAKWFTGREYEPHIIAQIHAALRMQVENVVLIGMPGCGKSTIAKELAALLGRDWVDADAEIEKLAGCPIPHIFAQQGEDAFRALESRVLQELSKRSGIIIATGGGCVTRRENYAPLHANSRIVWICREISALPTNGRPLSQSTDLAKMYALRKPLYEAFSDITVCNDGTPAQTAEAIRRLL